MPVRHSSAGQWVPADVRAARHVLRYLRSQGLAAPPARRLWPPLVVEYLAWLSERGIRERTAAGYAVVVARLVAALGPEPRAYDAASARGQRVTLGTRPPANEREIRTGAARERARQLGTSPQCAHATDRDSPRTQTRSCSGSAVEPFPRKARAAQAGVWCVGRVPQSLIDIRAGHAAAKAGSVFERFSLPLPHAGLTRRTLGLAPVATR